VLYIIAYIIDDIIIIDDTARHDTFIR